MRTDDPAPMSPAEASAGQFAVQDSTNPSERDRLVPPGVPVIGAGGPDHDRIAADDRLMQRVYRDGVGSAAWEQLVEHVHDYARATLRRKARDGTLARHMAHAAMDPQQQATARRVGHRLATLAERSGGRQVLEDAIAEALVRTLRYWATHVVPDRRWHPEGGAQLRTWFVRLALVKLVRTGARALRDHGEVPASQAMVDRELTAAAADPRGGQSMAARLVEADTAARRWHEQVAPELTDVEVRIVELVAAGLEHAEIAGELGLTERAVEGRLYRLRRRLADVA